MTEEESEKSKDIEAFKESFKLGIQTIFSMLEVAPDLYPPDPFSYSEGEDERTFEELSEEEKKAAREVLYQELGIDPKKPQIREYESFTQAEIKRPSGEILPAHSKIKVSVLPTNKSEEGIYLTEMVFEDNETRWMIGPDQDI